VAVISCHIHPDGDALGSALALHRALANAGRGAVVSFSEPFMVAPHYRFLADLDRLVPPSQVPKDADLFVCFDAGSLDRLGTLVDAFRGAARTVVVDHHASNTRFGDVNLIDAASPASAVLCRELLRRLGLPLDTEIATALYTGLVTDTGRFQYQATSPDTHLLAAELLAAGVQQYEVAKAVFETNNIGYLRLVADALGRVAQVPEASLVWTRVDQADLAAHGIDMDETEGLIDLVRTDGRQRRGRRAQAAALRAATRSRCAPRGPPMSARWPPASAAAAQVRRRLHGRPGRRGGDGRPGRRADRRPGQSPGRVGGWRRGGRGARLRQAGGADLPRRRRPGAPPGRPAPGRPRRHPRPARHRGPGHGPRPGHPAAAVPAHRAQALPGRGRFGAETDTLDAAGTVTATAAADGVDTERLRAAMAGFLGPQEQVPPMVSAIKVGGERLYAKARRGEEVERAPRPIVIHDLELLGLVHGERPVATISVVCSGGTYVRSLAADLGRSLGTLAHLASLRRTAVGRFAEADAHTLEELAEPGSLGGGPCSTRRRRWPRRRPGP
jgi:phosphoesterase RecJ-like protein